MKGHRGDLLHALLLLGFSLSHANRAVCSDPLTGMFLCIYIIAVSQLLLLVELLVLMFSCVDL